jgi:hypothetical protein
MMVLRYRGSYNSEEDNVGERTVRRITGRSKKETASNLPSVTPCLYKEVLEVMDRRVILPKYKIRVLEYE